METILAQLHKFFQKPMELILPPLIFGIALFLWIKQYSVISAIIVTPLAVMVVHAINSTLTELVVVIARGANAKRAKRILYLRVFFGSVLAVTIAALVSLVLTGNEIEARFLENHERTRDAILAKEVEDSAPIHQSLAVFDSVLEKTTRLMHDLDLEEVYDQEIATQFEAQMIGCVNQGRDQYLEAQTRTLRKIESETQTALSLHVLKTKTYVDDIGIWLQLLLDEPVVLLTLVVLYGILIALQLVPTFSVLYLKPIEKYNVN